MPRSINPFQRNSTSSSFSDPVTGPGDEDWKNIEEGTSSPRMKGGVVPLDLREPRKSRPHKDSLWRSIIVTGLGAGVGLAAGGVIAAMLWQSLKDRFSDGVSFSAENLGGHLGGWGFKADAGAEGTAQVGIGGIPALFILPFMAIFSAVIGFAFYLVDRSLQQRTANQNMQQQLAYLQKQNEDIKEDVRNMTKRKEEQLQHVLVNS